MSGTGPLAVRHPEHARLVRDVRGWYLRSYPEMGYVVEPRRLGAYARQPDGRGRVIVDDLEPQQVPELLADVRRYFAGAPVSIWLDEAGRDALLGPAFLAHGCAPGRTLVYLAHVGPLPEPMSIPELHLEPVSESNLHEWVATKLKGFAGSDEDPDPADIEMGLAVRRAEMAGEGCLLIARLGTEPAGIAGWYEGEDRLIFNLATRVPFRGRGVARAMLTHLLHDAAAHGTRSVIINAVPDDAPVRLYHRMGFIDEVYWRREYRLSPDLRVA